MFVMSHLLDPDDGVMEISEVLFHVVVFTKEEALLCAKPTYQRLIVIVLFWSSPVVMGTPYRWRRRKQHIDHAAGPCHAKPGVALGLDLGG